MLLTDLPIELLAGLPAFLRNIEDFTNAASSCRALHNAFSLAEPNTILRLAANSAPTFFSPHPWFLVLATARGVGDWAIGNPSRTERLRKAFQGGMEGLLDLCIEVGGLTMQDIRRLHLARFSLINPLSDKLDQIAGTEWYVAENFWNGGVSDAWTVQCTVQRTAFQMMIYWELFGTTLRAYLEPESQLPKFDLDTRLDYVKYCVPDWICAQGYPGFEVLPVGPYLPDSDASKEVEADQTALQFILFSGRWARLWEKPMLEVGPAFDDEWRQALWTSACYSFGLESIEIIKDMKVTSRHDARYLPSKVVQPEIALTPAWNRRLSAIREQIRCLDADRHKPGTLAIGTILNHPVSEAPTLSDEAYVCMARLWPGTG